MNGHTNGHANDAKNVLITGANRGLGKGLLQRYLNLPNHTVIAAVRNPERETSRSLSKLPRADHTRLIVVKINALLWQDAFDAIQSLPQHGVDRLDIVIANAGVASCWPTVADLSENDFMAHMVPNVNGIVSLYQACRPLLNKSTREPVFVTMGSTAGSLNTRLPFPNAAYGPSKAAAAWLTIQINDEEQYINAFGLVPGWVHTDMGDLGAKVFGVDEATKSALMISTDVSCDGMMQVLEGTTKKCHGGKLVLYDGTESPW